MSGRWFAWLIGALGLLAQAQPVLAGPTSPETVVLLHGLGRDADAMDFLASRLRRAGFETIGIDYPSRRLAPEALLALLRQQLLKCCVRKQRVHFVGHSLGGLLVRGLLAEHLPLRLGRVVLLGTPNHGSELADLLQRGTLGWARDLAGPSAARLGTGANSFPNQLPAPHYEVGVIAGDRSLNPIGSWLIPGADDGMVSVASTRLHGMRDFLIAPTDHILMRYSQPIADAVIHFLRHGRFPTPEVQ